jgi:hypothetical protein
MGSFLKKTPDSIETGLWQYVKQDTSLVLFGNFSNGMPIKDWQFILNDGRRFSSTWSVYQNSTTACRFSLPFDYEETIIDSTCFKLTTINDSLGKMIVVLIVDKPIYDYEKLIGFGHDSDSGLLQQGFTFIQKNHKSNSDYSLTEFFMRNSLGKDVKFYRLYGNLPSKHRFVELSLFHDGPKDELAKLIFNLIANHLYVSEERFYNPYKAIW